MVMIGRIHEKVRARQFELDLNIRQSCYDSPMTISIQTPQNALFSGFVANDHVANVTLLTGPSWSSLHVMSQFFAALLLCDTPGEEPCETCPQCHARLNNTHIDFIQLSLAERIKIDDIREVQESIKYGPTKSKRMVVLISHAELMTEQAANACLKSFESPPEGVHFVLLAPSSKSLLDTIVSRCQEIRIPSLNPDQISSYLQDKDPARLEIYNKFPKFPDALKSQLCDLLETHDAVEPLSFPVFLKANPIEDFDLAENWAKDPDLCRFYLMYWMEQLWFFRTKMPQAISAQEIIIENILNMQYNVNLKLQLEAMFLSIRKLW